MREARPGDLRAVPPAHRGEGERLPPFAGDDPSALGWVRVDDLLWMTSAEAAIVASGAVPSAAGPLPPDAVFPAETTVESGFVLRTDHVLLRTNVSWNVAIEVAREAESHVLRLFATWGERLDLRFPADPLHVLLFAGRDEFSRHLAHRVAEPVGWGAFYDASTGIVNVCMEPAPRGALPWVSDLRHEMTHQIVDLSRAPRRRGRAFAVPWFWLWEGIAIESERLGDPPDRPSNAARLGRFRRRLRMGQWAPLRDLAVRDGREFEGRHYDQTATWMAVLLDPADPARADRVLDAVRALVHGETPPSLTALLGTSIEAHEAEWLAVWRARFGRRRP